MQIGMAERLMSASGTFTVFFATRQAPPVPECAAWFGAATNAIFKTKTGLGIPRASYLIKMKLPFNDTPALRRAARQNTGDLVVLGRNVYRSSRQGRVRGQGAQSPLWAFMHDGNKSLRPMRRCACVLCGQTWLLSVLSRSFCCLFSRRLRNGERERERKCFNEALNQSQLIGLVVWCQASHDLEGRADLAVIATLN